MTVLLVLTIDLRLEDELTDYLLLHAGAFTSRQVHDHGGELKEMSIAEQVSGRRGRLQFDLLLEEDEVDALLAGMKEQVGGDILWRTQPVARHGRL